MSKLNQLSRFGQSVWFDYIRRAFINSGELQALLNQGVRGVTSNPSIFEKAIAGSVDYDDRLKELVSEEKSVPEIYQILALEDIAAAADLLRPVYASTDGLDGYVSLEVSPTLAHDTNGTVLEARTLFAKLNRPNIMIKVPATKAGIPAIAELIGLGINVNVTLIFGMAHYEAVADAYLSGLAKLKANGGNLKKVASVASFFVSRVDTAVDEALAAKGNDELQGKIAIANSKAAYALAQKIFSGAGWNELATAGATVQRLLWASTGTKNARYPDTLYVEQLIGQDTVNTVPPATLTAFQDHGTVAETLAKDLEEAEQHLSQLHALGIDLTAITEKLQKDGVAAFAKSFETLMASITEKKERLRTERISFKATLHGLQTSVDKALNDLKKHDIMRRIWSGDHTVWGPDPTEISNRLGWLHSPDVMLENLAEITTFVDEVRAAGYTDALLLGMGGSSLAPEVFRLTFGVQPGYLDLSILDSTDPGAVLEFAETLNLKKTLFIVSTKSGGTVETLSFFKYFYNLTAQVCGSSHAGEHFVAITDPGSKLVELAREWNFRKTFINDPNIGGRYSALSYFGLVPAAMVGVDLECLLARAARMACNCESCNCPVAGDNSGAWLGAIMGETAAAGKDKLTLIVSPPISAFGAWVEQLIAESTGKNGTGILPVAGEELGLPEDYVHDRLFVYLRLEGDSTYDNKVHGLLNDNHPVVQLHLKDLYDLGGEFFRWEMATVIAGRRLDINPFDQPNVESAKVLAREMVRGYHEKGTLPKSVPDLETDDMQIFTNVLVANAEEALCQFLAQIKPGDGNGSGRSYVALQAYIQPTEESNTALQQLRQTIRDHYRVATTVGYGPRFLHSTGQLHKGDAGNGLFIQFTNAAERDTAIPDNVGQDKSSMSFGVLKAAQALGDRQALLEGGRKIIRFHFKGDVIAALNRLNQTLS